MQVRDTRDVGYQIKTLDHMIGRKIMNILLENGMDQVTVMHGWIIAYLYENQDKDIYQKDLEGKFCISRSTVTNILKLMEKKGYIDRISVEKDARLKKLVLTDKAKALQQKNFIDIHNRVEKQMTKNISAENMNTFLEVILKMKENLEEGDRQHD